MNIRDILVPTYRQMLEALARWLDKAAAAESAGGDAEDGADILAARLAGDMFPLATQIRFACIQALEGVCRTTATPFPDDVAQMLEEGRAAGEAAGTLAAAKDRIARTIALVDEIARTGTFLDDPIPIAHAIPNGMVFDLTAGQYVRDWALPQFYFHLMAAYAILRHTGAELGKADYVSHMFGFIRPGTMPQA